MGYRTDQRQGTVWLKKRPIPSNRRGLNRRRGLSVETLERRELLAADTLQINIENLADNGGLLQTPFWVAVHDGAFDVANVGESATGFGGLESLAEEGDTSGLLSRFAADGQGHDAVVLAPDGFAGAPVFEPGEAASTDLFVADTLQSQYFSFASMVIPSNDALIANLDPLSIRLFDAAGDFLGTRTIVVYGADLLDAGTELNDPSGGAAFTTAGGTSVDENGQVGLHLGLDEFEGAALPTGETLARAYDENTPIARITISQASDPSAPVDSSGPRTALQVETLSDRSDFHEIHVVYSDPSGIDLNSIGVENLRVTGPLLTQLDVLSVQTDASPGTVPREVSATYRVAPSSGSFTAVDNGTYSVVLLGDQVNDPFGHTSPATRLGEFEVMAPVQLNVSFENLSDTGGLANTPVFIAAHNGNFEIARAGSSAADFGGLETLAEEGDLGELISRFNSQSDGSSGVILAPDGFAGAPVFEPGEFVSQTLDIFDPEINRFFSYASMVIPSNDAFIANLDPRSIELFDRFGNFTGARTLTLYGNSVWDAGTEVNDPLGGAAFSTEGGDSADENGVVRRHTGLDDFIGTGLPTGQSLDAGFGDMTPIGRITIGLSDLPVSPIDDSGPLATLDVSNASVVGQATHEVRVTYSDASGVDVNSIGVGDLRVDGAFNQSLQVVSVTTDAVPGEVNKTVNATYQIAPINGEPFSTFENGLYFVNLVENQVGDTLANQSAATSLGSFEVLVPIRLQITVENLSPAGGLAQTPFWVGVHEGSFEIARANRSASDFDGLESIAEEGDVSGLAERFAIESSGAATVVTAPEGFTGAPVFEPGEISFEQLDVIDTNANRYFSFASMVIPSNDAFIANLNPRAYELFDSEGFFTGERTITIVGRDLWDAGTEVNDVNGGAAFSTVGGTSIDEGGVIRRHGGLDDFVGTLLPTGETLLSGFEGDTPIARITVSLFGASAVPVDQQGPTASLTSLDVDVAGQTSHEIQVTYHDPSGLDLTSIDVDDIRIVGPLDSELIVTDVVVEAGAADAPQSVSVTYTVTTDDGPFTARNNGQYFVSIQDDQVVDTLGRDSGIIGLGAFTVDVGVRLQVEIESLSPATGLSQTPFWVGFHDGGFEVARGGVSASQFGGLELIAEEGDPSGLIARFAAESTGTDSVVIAPDGFPGAPIFEPGEIASQIIEIDDTHLNRHFSFASMVIPSNDAFVANRDSRRYELFDSRGNFNGARQITLYGRDILDAGTESNDPQGGAAFSTQGGLSADEMGLIRVHPGLDEFVGTGLPTGQPLGVAFDSLSPIAVITISLVDPEADVCSGILAACSSRSVDLQNSVVSGDVNRDGRVSPLDALLVINFLSRFGNQATISDEAQATGLALDVEGNEQISPSDALAVINVLARSNDPSNVGEGETALAFDAAIEQLDFSGPTIEESSSRESELFDPPGRLF